jgi:hypothetical protein
MSNEGHPRRTGTPLLAGRSKGPALPGREGLPGGQPPTNRRVEELLEEILVELRELSRRIVRDQPQVGARVNPGTGLQPCNNRVASCSCDNSRS